VNERVTFRTIDAGRNLSSHRSTLCAVAPCNGLNRRLSLGIDKCAPAGAVHVARTLSRSSMAPARCVTLPCLATQAHSRQRDKRRHPDARNDSRTDQRSRCCFRPTALGFAIAWFARLMPDLELWTDSGALARLIQYTQMPASFHYAGELLSALLALFAGFLFVAPTTTASLPQGHLAYLCFDTSRLPHPRRSSRLSDLLNYS
jgi:hypothetical protein